MRLENGDDFFVRKNFPRAGESRPDLVGVVRVIVVNQCSFSGFSLEFKAPPDPAEIFERSADSRLSRTQHPRGCGGCLRVPAVVSARHRDFPARNIHVRIMDDRGFGFFRCCLRAFIVLVADYETARRHLFRQRSEGGPDIREIFVIIEMVNADTGNDQNFRSEIQKSTAVFVGFNDQQSAFPAMKFEPFASRLPTITVGDKPASERILASIAAVVVFP